MSRFEFMLATTADDGDLRRVLSSTPMSGRIRVAFAREPSYFAAAEVDGKTVQVGICRDTTIGRVVGMGSRAVSPRYVNGQPQPVGYLSGLRLLPQYRGQGRLLARGYQFLRQLHADNATNFYLTTIADDNEAAIRLLTSGRGGLPIYQPWGRYVTMVMNTKRNRRGRVSNDALDCRTATTADGAMILKFLRAHGPTRQFFPDYEESDLFTDAGLLKGLRPDDITLAFLNDELVGTLAAWDQRGFKQTFVCGYAGWLRFARPLYNACAWLARRPLLPQCGAMIDADVGAIPVVRGDDFGVFTMLLERQLDRLATRGTCRLLFGLHENDPLLSVARRYTSREYVTRLYIVTWPDGCEAIGELKGRVPYLELGCL
jgi:hypothetical protein